MKSTSTLMTTMLFGAALAGKPTPGLRGRLAELRGLLQTSHDRLLNGEPVNFELVGNGVCLDGEGRRYSYTRHLGTTLEDCPALCDGSNVVGYAFYDDGDSEVNRSEACFCYHDGLDASGSGPVASASGNDNYDCYRRLDYGTAETEEDLEGEDKGSIGDNVLNAQGRTGDREFGW